MIIINKNSPLFFLFLILFSFSYSQEKRGDAYVKDTASAGLLFRKAYHLKDAEEAKALKTADSAIEIGLRCGFMEVVIDAMNLKGRMHMDENRLSMAYEEFQKADDYCIEIHDSLRLSDCLNNMGDVYKQLGMQREAVHLIERAISIAERMNNSDALASYCNRIGHVYMDWGEAEMNPKYYDKALEYYNRSLKVNLESGHKRMLCVSYVNLANSYLVMMKHGGDTSYASISVNYSSLGIKTARENNIRDQEALNMLNTGEAFLLRKEYDKALINFEKAYKIYKELNIVLWEAATLRDLSLANKGKGENKKAILYVQQANELVKNFNNTEQYDNFLLLSKLYESLNEHSKALEAYKKYHELLNLENNVKSTIQLERVHVEHENEEKDESIRTLNEQMQLIQAEQKAKTMLNYFLIGSVILVLVVTVLVFNRSRLMKQAKELSDEARIMQEQFLANTSHEIRTPLNGIMGMTEQLLHTSLSKEQQEYIQVIRTSSENLLRIISDLLDLSKIKAGKLDFYNKKFDSQKFFRGIELQVRKRAEEKNLQLSFIVSNKIPAVLKGDALRLQQVILNLTENAIKFTEKGSVTFNAEVKSESAGSCVMKFSVSDTGPGIPAEHLNSIFDSFVQLENAGERKHGGSGLGLAIVKYLVHGQKGDIAVRSKEGEGTVFEFEIPFLVPENTELPANETASGRMDLNQIKILAVEDNQINQKVLESTFAKWNCEYVIVDAAVKAFDELAKEKFDIVLMDIELPAISGIEATKYIRQKFSNENKNVPIIALTAYAMESERIKCLDAGMNEVVTKPFNPSELYEKIEHLLGKNLMLTSKVEKISAPDFSFSELLEKYAHDKEGLKELLQLFSTELPEYAEELKTTVQLRDATKTMRQIHKMKSPIGLFGKSELLENLHLLDTSAAKGFDENTDSLLQNCLQLIEELKQKVDNSLKEEI